MSNPLYSVGDEVYFKESAAIGFLEVVEISSLHKYGSQWVYSISEKVSPIAGSAIYGDRISAVNTNILYYTEDEFVTKCEALELATANAKTKYESLKAQLDSICPSDDSTE